jgi:hypothetical protein
MGPQELVRWRASFHLIFVLRMHDRDHILCTIEEYLLHTIASGDDAGKSMPLLLAEDKKAPESAVRARGSWEGRIIEIYVYRIV